MSSPANPSWHPGATITSGSVVIDPVGNVQQATVAGTTGTTLPQFSAVVGALTPDGSVEWTCIAVLSTGTLPAALTRIPAPEFIDLDPRQVLQEMIEAFEGATGRTLYPAQLERLLVNLYAYRESLLRNQVQYVGQQCLLAFASYPSLDHLCALVGVRRLPASGAKTVLRFELAEALARDVLIEAGSLVATQDGAVHFATDRVLTIPAGETVGNVSATCTTPGTAGNGYLAGKVSVLVRGDAAVSSVRNTATTADGAPIESDDVLRARAQLAPNRFTTAGPADAYRFHAMGVDPAITDVSVDSDRPGHVIVTVLAGPITTQPAPSPNFQAIPPYSTVTDESYVFSSTGTIALPYRAVADVVVASLSEDERTVHNAEVDYTLDANAGVISILPSGVLNPGQEVVVTLRYSVLLDAVAVALGVGNSQSGVRPMCDYVHVQAASEVPYAVEGVITLRDQSDAATAKTAIEIAARNMAMRAASRLAQDLVPEEWIAALGSIGSVYRAQIISPTLRRLAAGEWANCTSVALEVQDEAGNVIGHVTLGGG